jgi:hypothetical protein
MPAPAGAAGRQVRALSIDADLQHWLQGLTARACVHSVFGRVINVDVGGERLLALACRSADDAPDSIVVDLDSWSAFDVATQAAVYFGEGRIALDAGPTIVLDAARPWRGQLPAYPDNEAALRANLSAAREHLDRYGRGIGARASPAAAGLPAAVATAFHDDAGGLCRALAQDDRQRAHAHVERLLGLGTGLTPSGDDFLLGLLAALHLPGGPARDSRRIGVHVLGCAGRRTHAISASALRHAARGRVRARIVDLFDALAHAPVPTMLPALDRVMAIGSGSGSEIAVGVLAGLQLHLDRAAMRRHRTG